MTLAQVRFHIEVVEKGLRSMGKKDEIKTLEMLLTIYAERKIEVEKSLDCANAMIPNYLDAVKPKL